MARQPRPGLCFIVIFQNSGRPTIVAKKKTKCKLGQREGFSDTDIRSDINIVSNNFAIFSVQEAEHSVPVPGLPDHRVLSHLGSEAHQQACDECDECQLLYRYQQVSPDISSLAGWAQILME